MTQDGTPGKQASAPSWRWIVYPILLLALSGVGVMGWFHFRKVESAPRPEPTEEDPVIRYSEWLTKVAPDQTEAATSDLAGLVRFSDNEWLCKEVPDLASKDPASITPQQLCQIKEIRQLVKQSSPDPLALLNKTYRPVMKDLAGGADFTPQQVVKLRDTLNAVGDAWEELRQAAVAAPNSGDQSLVWLDLMHRTRGGDIPAVFLPSRPVLPVFGDREAVLVQNLGIWLNSRSAQLSFSRDRFPELYRNGTISPLPKELSACEDRWTESIKQESARAVMNRSAAEAAQYRDAYLALRRFLNLFSDKTSQL